MASTITQKTVNIDSLTTSTWYSIVDGVRDQVFKITPFLNKLQESGQIREKALSGTHWEVAVRTEKQDQNIESFGKGNQFGVSDQEFMTRMIVYPKNIGTSITRYWTQEAQNMGPAKLLDYVEELVDATRMSLLDYFETNLITGATGTDDMTGLDELISTTPTTGTVQGITRSTNTWTHNLVTDVDGVSGTNPTPFATLLDVMDSMYNRCSEYKGMGPRRSPDLILCSRQVYQLYERGIMASGVLQWTPPIQTKRANLGFGSLFYKDAELLWSPGVASDRMYFLNSGSLEFRIQPGLWMEMTPWKWLDGRYLDRTAQIVCRGNLVATNFRNQGVLHDILLSGIT
tara:strand:+ start:10171 stop:11202 length:1032 start_codon:yes stop_codon:yes gene_type:complete